MRATWPLVLAGILLLGGCGPGPAPTPVAPSTSAFPPRPAALRLNGLDPCTVLGTVAQHELGVRVATEGTGTDPTCQWNTVGGAPVNRWQFQLATGYGADAGLALDGARMTRVAGFGAVETEGLDYGTSCRVWVDVAPGENLNVLYSNSDGARRDMSHQLACQLSDQAAALVVSDLSELAGVRLPPAGADPTPPAAAPSAAAPPTAAPPADAAPPSANQRPVQFPPRPASLSLEGIDPCSVLSAGEVGRLGARTDIGITVAPVNYCGWKQTGARNGGWKAKLVTYQGAGAAVLNYPGTATFGTLDGYGVAETHDPTLGADINCRLSIDVAAEQSLEVDYQSVLNDDGAPMNHQLACQRAYQVARPALANLRARR